MARNYTSLHNSFLTSDGTDASFTAVNATDAIDGIVGLATQAEMETGTATGFATVVTPGRMQNHPGVAKAWGYLQQ